MKTIKQKAIIPAPPDRVFKAWLDSTEHGRMIGAHAEIHPIVGGSFSIWDGSITGSIVVIDPKKHRIEQTWHSDYDDWPFNEPSRVYIEFKAKRHDRTQIVLEHKMVPDKHAADVARGWQDYYWTPMQTYFAQVIQAEKDAAAK